MRRLIVTMLTAWLMLGLAVSSAPAQTRTYLTVTGRLFDAAGTPLVGYRAVFQPTGEAHTYHSGPSGPQGEYLISLPQGGAFEPVALITSAGRRIPLQEQSPLRADPGVLFDIRMGGATGPPVTSADQTPDPTIEPVEQIAPVETYQPETMVTVQGQVSDSAGIGLADHRVIYYSQEGVEIYISFPSETSGQYAILLPIGRNFVPTALIAPNGARISLEDQAVVQAAEGARRDVTVSETLAVTADLSLPIFEGADRLFLSFVEDAGLPEFQRYEARLEFAESPSAHLMATRFIGEVQLPMIPDATFGASVGFGSLDLGVSDESGMTDMDLWAKLNLGKTLRGAQFTVGGLFTLPVGDEDAGLSQDSYSAKLFGAVRYPLAFGSISAHLGIRGSDNGVIAGAPVEGELSGSGGIAFTRELDYNLMMVLEAKAESARFKNGETDARALLGCNWKVNSLLNLRLAVAFGLADGAPDSQAFAGVSIEL